MPKPKKKPRLVTAIFVLMALSFFGAIVWGASIVIRMAWRWIQELVYTVSTMDTVIIIALISGMVTVLGLVVNSAISMSVKKSEHNYKRKAILLKKLEAPYTQFVHMLFDMVQKKEDAEALDSEIRAKLIRDMSREIILYGSDTVVKKWVSYRKKAPTFTLEQHLNYIEEILHLIRSDMGIKKGGLNPGDLLALFVEDIERFEDADVSLSLFGLRYTYTHTDDEDEK